jgi:hypothetical protein
MECGFALPSGRKIPRRFYQHSDSRISLEIYFFTKNAAAYGSGSEGVEEKRILEMFNSLPGRVHEKRIISREQGVPFEYSIHDYRTASLVRKK